ncbi:TetR/AcrR family transcriptional regulator [Nocardia uniformis]|uniref:TetR/AcrR family transcriptional regulator n=1 Tax=Nocardia uniformis TaxID=53432 RepID=A0A849C768_9NOCA|nr:TetR/AcrR family transcriptional regulator [Nocardia uniformis]NNH73596.1 TetR/AcrR family transcriptional regulator [Nocardia uniformis]
MDPQRHTRDRILTEAMRLFGEQGFKATSIAEIEAAAGLSPGSGSLYRHFKSKTELLREGVRHQLDSGAELLDYLGDTEAVAALPLRERLTKLVTAGFARLEAERDLNRLVVNDLGKFPELMDRVGAEEMRRVAIATGAWLAAQDPGSDRDRDWTAIALVLTSAAANYWQLRDVFGTHPTGVSEADFIAAVVELAYTLIVTPGAEQ